MQQVHETKAFKTEPQSKAVNVGAVSDIGLQQVRYVKIPIYEGRGLKAPMEGESTHKSGSQGRY